jgi:hypothetical protein
MADEGHGVSLAILGIVAVIAVVGLVLLFNGAIGQAIASNPAFPAAKIYGGNLRQGESELRPVGEEPARYTSPVPYDEGGTFYSQREGWIKLNRDECPNELPVKYDIAQVGGRTDCLQTQVNNRILYCCPETGQMGQIRSGEYEG